MEEQQNVEAVVQQAAPEYEYDVLVFIGRLRLFHNGHKAVIDEALKKARHVVILIGSANRPRDIGNEFTADEAQQMVEAVYPIGTEEYGRMTIRQINDYVHDNDFIWLAGVHKAVRKAWQSIAIVQAKDYKPKIGLIGHSKDKTSYYLKKFPQWKSVSVPGFKVKNTVLSATALRSTIFYSDMPGVWRTGISQFIPQGVYWWLIRWAEKHDAKVHYLRGYDQFIEGYKDEHQFRGKLDEDGKPLGKSYKPTHNTIDSVVIQSGHVLMIRRKDNPGKGLWALPGGFLDPEEYTLDGAIRELREETLLRLSEETLKLAFRFKLQFNMPHRSKRGRISTAAHLFLLNDREVLPYVEGDDDADKAEWIPLGDLDPKMMFEDHYHMIWKMLNMLPPQ